MFRNPPCDRGGSERATTGTPFCKPNASVEDPSIECAVGTFVKPSVSLNGPKYLAREIEAEIIAVVVLRNQGELGIRCCRIEILGRASTMRVEALIKLRLVSHT